MLNTKDGRIESLHLHPPIAGAPMRSVSELEVVEQRGIVGNTRYFGRTSSRTGEPTRRQVTLMEREVIAEHAAALGLEVIPPGAVRSNIETCGIDLVPLIGRKVRIGAAELLVCEARTPCHKMDFICQGLRALMENSRQGVLAQVVRGGIIRIGDPVLAL